VKNRWELKNVALVQNVTKEKIFEGKKKQNMKILIQNERKKKVGNEMVTCLGRTWTPMG